MKIIGHRGARGLAPENTLAALRKGLEHKADLIEYDLRVTKDGTVVLHHDPELTDPNGQKHDIIKTSYKDLKNHKADLATFEEALTTLKNKVTQYVEVKPGVDTRPIITILKGYCSTGGKDIALASKSQETLLELHKAFPETPKIVIEPWSGVRARRRANQVNTKVVAMNQWWLWWGFIRGFKNSEWQLYTYTLNDPKKAARWEHWGLAGVVTDYPDRFDR